MSIPDTVDSVAARMSSATIIFNLALVDHLSNRFSTQAISLYELASTLISGYPCNTLGLALLNNIGVWCYESGDTTASERCMKELLKLVEKHGDSMDPRERQGVLNNIHWFLNPHFTASPAA